MDLQCARLLELVNDLDAAEASGASRAEIVEAVFDLLRDFGAHFTEEEMLMGTYAYPDLAEHRAAHDRFSMDLASAVSDFLIDTVTSVVPLVDRVRSRFEDHIRVQDAPLVEYLQVARTKPHASTRRHRS